MAISEVECRRQEQEERPKPTKLAVFISNKGTGSNLQVVIDAINRKDINCEIGIVVSDKADAKGLDRTRNHQVPSIVLPYKRKEMTREEYGVRLGQRLNEEGVEVAILAGFMTILPPTYFNTFNGNTINVHPGLLPDEEDGVWYFPDGTQAPWNRSLMTEDAVKNFLGLKYAGSTWHVATEKTDFGPVLKRVITEVLSDDTVDSLYERLKKEEHKGLINILRNPPVKK